MIVTLKSDAELKQARQELARRGLDFSQGERLRPWSWFYRVRFRTPMPAADPMKSWDVLKAVEILEKAVPDRDAPVLDMGCYNSEILYALMALGYTHLHGCDLNPLCRWMPFWNRIHYRAADMTKTPYADGSFAAITSISAIEHGVPLDPWTDEMSRLLRPGGLVLLTTDFDASGQPHAIDKDFRVFGQPWRIFTPESLDETLAKFAAKGFHLLEPENLDRSHTERPIHWNNEDYTFVMAVLRKAG